jgi:RNA polymerase sigma factor (sigma-70 family)
MRTAKQHRDRRPSLRSVAERNKLAEANIRFVHFIVRDLQARNNYIAHVDYDDAVQYGMLGLLRAAELFEPERNLSFRTYAAIWIRQAIQQHLPDQYPIRVPIKTFTCNVHEDLSRFLEPIDADMSDDGSNTPADWWCRVADRRDMDNEEECERLMEVLTPHERRIVRSRYMRQQSTKQISERYGVSRQCVDEWLRKAILKMRLIAIANSSPP